MNPEYPFSKHHICHVCIDLQLTLLVPEDAGGLAPENSSVNASTINRVEVLDEAGISDIHEDDMPFENEGSTYDINEEERSYDYEEHCMYRCPEIHDFFNLTDELIETIIDLEDELVRWRQALIKYLPEDWATGLRQDIFNNLSRYFEGEPAYDLYVNMKSGEDPQQSKERSDRLWRLAEGTDDTSITYL